jgi:membrane protein
MWPDRAWRVLRAAIDEARADDVPTTAQALAYALFLAIPGILLVTLGAFSLVADDADVARLIDRLEGVVPEEAATLLEDSLRRSAASARDGIAMTVVGFVLALWATTSAATTLMGGLTTAFDRRDGRPFVRKRLTALAIVVCLLAAVGLVLGLLVLGPHLERWVGQASGAPTLTAWAWWTAQWPILIGGLLVAFAVVLAIGPDATERRWQLVTPGAVVAVVVWLVASGGFALFTARFGTYEKTWGTLSAVVVTLVWLWLSAAALLFGAEVNAEVERAAARERRSSSPPRADDVHASSTRPSEAPRSRA